MGRGKPFSNSVRRLVDADVIKKPAWMKVVEATRPAFRPVSVTRTSSIDYAEDRPRIVFLQKNPFARRIAVNMKADTVSDRHFADRFVDAQIKLMSQDRLSEDQAYDAAMQSMKSAFCDGKQIATEGFCSSLSDQKVTNEPARLYLASLRDSRRDKALYQALKTQANEDTSQ